MAIPDFSIAGQGNVISRILLPFRGSVYYTHHQQSTLSSFIFMLQSKETILRYRGLYLITKISSLAPTNVSVNLFLSHAPSRELDRTSMGLTKPCYIELTIDTVKCIICNLVTLILPHRKQDCKQNFEKSCKKISNPPVQ